MSDNRWRYRLHSAKAKNAELEQEIKELRSRALAAEARLADWDASVAAAMRQPCGEIHCSCVGPLVAEVNRLKAEVERMREEA